MSTITPQGYFNRNVSRFICFCYAAGYEINNLSVNANLLELECELYVNGFNASGNSNSLAAIAFWRTQNRFNRAKEGFNGSLIFSMEMVPEIKKVQ